jgi:hypothetical protein
MFSAFRQPWCMRARHLACALGYSRHQLEDSPFSRSIHLIMSSAENNLEKLVQEQKSLIEHEDRLIKRFTTAIRELREDEARLPSGRVWVFIAVALIPAAISVLAVWFVDDVPPGLVVALAGLSAIGLLGTLIEGGVSAIRNTLSLPITPRGRRWQLYFVGFHVAFLVLTFAVIYFTHTAVSTEHAVVGRVAGFDFLTAVYFSIVTLTAGGYGELVPMGNLRFYASAQMVSGYVLLAMFISALTAHLTRANEKVDVIPIIQEVLDSADIPAHERDKILEFVRRSLRNSGVYRSESEHLR